MVFVSIQRGSNVLISLYSSQTIEPALIIFFIEFFEDCVKMAPPELVDFDQIRLNNVWEKNQSAYNMNLYYVIADSSLLIST